MQAKYIIFYLGGEGVTLSLLTLYFMYDIKNCIIKIML